MQLPTSDTSNRRWLQRAIDDYGALIANYQRRQRRAYRGQAWRLERTGRPTRQLPTGIYPATKLGRYTARVHRAGAVINIGTYDTLDAAIAARALAQEEEHLA